MRKIYITLVILLAAMFTMAYFYFTKLNKETSSHEISLYAATANSGLVFSLQNDKSVFDILKGQELFEKLTGKIKFSQFALLKTKLVASPAVNRLITGSNIFIGFSAGKNKEIDYLISTQFNENQEKPLLLEALQSSGIKLIPDQGIMKLVLNDSTSFYLGLEKNLILLSDAAAPVKFALEAVSKQHPQEFLTYIKAHHKHTRNSLANLYIDFSRLPVLLKSVLPGALNGNLDVLNKQQAFASLTYNFSKERLFFTGNTQLNDQRNYLSLFTELKPQKSTLDNLLPDNTANFKLYAIPDYKSWKKGLGNWFALHKDEGKINKLLKDTEKEYHLNPDEIFPQYFKDQLISFQLKTGENLAAINLSNGDKLKQLLLDLSADYNQDIKVFKKAGLLYAYFGEPFRKFSKPYYIIFDNYMVFANQPGSLQDFMNSYQHDKLLISTPDYIDLFSQISNNSSITYYINDRNSVDLVRKAVYRPYYNHFIAADGWSNFRSFIYQLSGDQGTFQTNLLINTARVVIPDEDLTNK